jgi:basic membrane protein A
MNRKLVILVALLVSFVAFLAIGAYNAGGQSDASKKSFKIALLLASNKNDGGYFQDVYESTKAAASKYGASFSYVDNSGYDTKARTTILRNFAKQGANLIVVDGVEIDSAETAAKLFPKVQFLIHDGILTKTLPNLHAYIVEQGVFSYLVGVLAPRLTKSSKTGFIGGYQDVPSSQAGAGWKLGVRDGAKPGTRPPSVIGTIVGSYGDPAKTKQAAAAQIANGADVIYAYVDAGFLGAVAAVRESHKDVKLFSATVERCYLSNQVVGSAFADNHALVALMVSDYVNHRLPTGTKFFGAENQKLQSVRLCPKYRTPELEALVRKTTKAIVTGKIKLPKNVTGR